MSDWIHRARRQIPLRDAVELLSPPVLCAKLLAYALGLNRHAKLPASDGSLGTSITSNTLVRAGSYNVSLVATSFVKSGAGQVTFK